MTKTHKEIALKILRLAGIGGLFAVASLLNPRFPYHFLVRYLKREYNKSYSPAQLRGSMKYLRRKKFIAYTKGEFAITKAGQDHLQKALIQNLTIQKQMWDRKWRFITFDIPEELAAARHVFRRKLLELGFFNFQRSLFVIPYPCEQIIAKLTDTLGIAPHVHVITAERFPYDAKLVKHFRLVTK